MFYTNEPNAKQIDRAKSADHLGGTKLPYDFLIDVLQRAGQYPASDFARA